METKTMLLKYCIDYFAERAKLADDSIKMAQQSANEEQKSSAGDKYETARAMGHIARDMFAQTLDKAMQTLQFLQSMQLQKCSKAMLGSLIITKDTTYFVAASIGIVQLNQKSYSIISMATPIGRMLENKCVGDSIEHQGKKIEILEIQ